MRGHTDGDDEVARRSALLPRPALAAQPDLLPVLDARGDARVDDAALDVERDRGAGRRLTEGQRRDRREVGALAGAARRREPAAAPGATAEERRTFEKNMGSMQAGWTGTFEQLDAYIARVRP